MDPGVLLADGGAHSMDQGNRRNNEQKNGCNVRIFIAPCQSAKKSFLFIGSGQTMARSWQRCKNLFLFRMDLKKAEGESSVREGGG